MLPKRVSLYRILRLTTCPVKTDYHKAHFFLFHGCLLRCDRRVADEVCIFSYMQALADPNVAASIRAWFFICFLLHYVFVSTLQFPSLSPKIQTEMRSQ